MAKIRSGFVSNSSSSSFVILPITSDKFIEKYGDEILECIKDQDIYNLDIDEDDEDSYSDNIEGWWEDYDPEKHAGHRVGSEIYWNKY